MQNFSLLPPVKAFSEKKEQEKITYQIWLKH